MRNDAECGVRSVKEGVKTMATRYRVGVVFGGRSVEHEVSIVTAHQVIEAMNREKYDMVPLYITKDGRWFSGEKLRDLRNFKDLTAVTSGLDQLFLSPDPSVKGLVSAKPGGWFRRSKQVKLDLIFPVIHGTYGEDGTLQGLCELADLPYVGAGVLGSAVGMDKIIMKMVFRQEKLPIVNYVWLSRKMWERKPDEIIDMVEQELPYPLFVKPANLGSSVGITRARNQDELKFAIEVASHYDRRLIVEEGLTRIIEVNCSVLGNDDPVPSICEQPVSWEEFLSYEDKYLRGGKSQGMKGSDRRIPAPISSELTAEVQRLAVKAFKAVDCRGIARIDFLVDPEQHHVFVNEINTIPGSFSFYLWEPTGLKPPQLVDRVIELAFEAYEERKKSTYSYESNLLRQMGEKGQKG